MNVDDAAPRAKLLTRPFLLVSLAHFAIGLSGAFGVHLAGFLRQLGAGEAEIGRIVGTHALTALVLGPFVGKLMDARGARLAIRLGGALLLLASSGYLFVSNLGPFVYAVRMLDGAGGTLVYASLFTYAAEVVPAQRRTEGLALFGAAGMVTLGIGSQLGDFLLSFADYTALFATASGFSALGMLLTWPLIDVGTGNRDAARASLWCTAKQRDLLPIWLASFAFFFAMSGLLTFLKTFVLHSGHGSIGTFFSVYTLAALLLRVFFGSLPDRVGPTRMVAPALLAYAAGACVLSITASSVSFVLAGVLCGIGHGYAFPVFLSLTVTRARPEVRGSATALYTVVDWAGNVIAPPLLGLVIERFGYSAAFGTVAATITAGVVCFYVFDRQLRM